MYGRSNTGITGLASVIGGAMVLPNTSNNPMLALLAIIAIVIGMMVVVSFIVSRVIVARSTK